MNSIKYCLQETGLKLSEIDAIVYYDKPVVKFERLLTTFYEVAPRGLIPFIKINSNMVKREVIFKKINL